MNKYEQAIVESQRESAENRIRAEHNYLESMRMFGKKHYFPYHSEKFIDMVQMIREEVKRT